MVISVNRGLNRHLSVAERKDDREVHRQGMTKKLILMVMPNLRA